MGWVSQFFDDASNAATTAWHDVTNTAGETWTAAGRYVIDPAKVGLGSVTADRVKNTYMGIGSTSALKGVNITAQQSDVQNLLRDRKLDAATLGYSRDFADTASLSGKNLGGERGTKAEEEGALRFGVKTAALGVASYTAGYYGGANAATGGAAYGSAQAASRGDYAGAIAGAAGAAGLDVPAPILQLFPRGPAGQPGLPGGVTTVDMLEPAPWNGEGISTNSGFPAPGGSASLGPILAVVALVGAVVLLKRKGVL